MQHRAGERRYDAVIVGAGFTGLAAALQLVRAGKSVLILEGDTVPGGLASTFEFRNGARIEKFYHHWFNNDEYVPELARELRLDDQIITLPSKTAMYYNARFWRLSTPLDLLRFKPLSLIDRVRLGLLVFKVRRISDWGAIEHLSIREWLEPLCGADAYRVVWAPLIESKFSVFAEGVNAVWMWKKLVLRGSTRDAKGREELAYFKGGFGRFADAIAAEICRLGGEIRYNTLVTGALTSGNRIQSLLTREQDYISRQFLFTPALSTIADILDRVAPSSWIQSLRRVNYLGNVCLVLMMDRSLSDTYWLNVNDPDFPFVGVIEHTNFDDRANYGGKHIVFLSRYLAKADPVWDYSDERYLKFALEHLKRMFPDLQPSWVHDYRVWRAAFAQPVTERNYSRYLPPHETPLENALIFTMAQIYPEDRGTNYAIRDGRRAAKIISDRLS